MNDQIRKLVETATVTLPRLSGRGVLVPGGLVLTAAHCIDWNCNGFMASDAQLEEVEIADGRKFKMTVCACDPVADIAVLCAPDGQDHYDENRRCEQFFEETKPVALFEDQIANGDSIDAECLTHNKGWIKAKATNFGLNPNPTIFVEFSSSIEGGTSGGPIVSASGELLAVVSLVLEEEAANGPNPMVAKALPAWCLEMIRLAEIVG